MSFISSIPANIVKLSYVITGLLSRTDVGVGKETSLIIKMTSDSASIVEKSSITISSKDVGAGQQLSSVLLSRVDAPSLITEKSSITISSRDVGRTTDLSFTPKQTAIIPSRINIISSQQMNYLNAILYKIYKLILGLPVLLVKKDVGYGSDYKSAIITWKYLGNIKFENASQGISWTLDTLKYVKYEITSDGWTIFYVEDLDGLSISDYDYNDVRIDYREEDPYLHLKIWNGERYNTDNVYYMNKLLVSLTGGHGLPYALVFDALLDPNTGAIIQRYV